LASSLHACLSACPPAGGACRPGCLPAPLTLARLPSCGAAAPRAAQELELDEFGGPALIPQALRQPSMPRLRSLGLNFRSRREELLAPLWAAPWLPQLRELSVTATQDLGSAELAPLRAAPLLRKLSICIYESGGAPLTADDGRALAAAPLPELRELHARIAGPGFAAALAAAPWLVRLESLDICWREKPVGGQGAADGRALAAAPLHALKRLGLDMPEPGFVAACAAAAAWLSRLERLAIWGDGDLLGGGDGPPALAAVPFTALVDLSLKYYEFEPEPQGARLALLFAAPWFSRLQSLLVHGYDLGTACGSDGAALRALAAASLPKLTSLSLDRAGLSPADVSGVLSSAPWLATLTSLSLAQNYLHAPGHRALSLLHLPRLRTLSLGCNGLDGTGLAALVSAPWLTQLANLKIADYTDDPGFASSPGHVSVQDALNDDAWVFGRLRRLGCAVNIRKLLNPGAAVDDDYNDESPSGSEPPESDDEELGSDDEEPESDDEPGGDEPGIDPGDA
jgi:hypothetical protein